MLDLNKESFDYNGWHYEFCRDIKEMYELSVIAKRNGAIIKMKLITRPKTYARYYYQVFTNKYTENSEKQAIENFKKSVMEGVIEFI